MTCVDCDLRQAPQQFVSLEKVLGLSPNATEDDLAKALKEHGKSQDKDDRWSNFVDQFDIQIMHQYDEGPFDKDKDPVFDGDQPASKFVRKPDGKQPTDWEPCKFREDLKSITGCDTCKKYGCNNAECPLFRKAVVKKDCKECQYRQP
jgi:hypothetical protein